MFSLFIHISFFLVRGTLLFKTYFWSHSDDVATYFLYSSPLFFFNLSLTQKDTHKLCVYLSRSLACLLTLSSLLSCSFFFFTHTIYPYTHSFTHSHKHTLFYTHFTSLLSHSFSITQSLTLTNIHILSAHMALSLSLSFFCVFMCLFTIFCVSDCEYI